MSPIPVMYDVNMAFLSYHVINSHEIDNFDLLQLSLLMVKMFPALRYARFYVNAYHMIIKIVEYIYGEFTVNFKNVVIYYN